MARKPRDHEADDPAEREEREAPSRSARKRRSHDLRRLGQDLAALRPERLRALPLPEHLQDAIAEAQRLSSFGARRRQLQFVGKLMRELDEASLAAVRDALARH